MSEELKAAQARIACLEGEIAKRDEELAACRIAVENCEVFRARIAELEQDLAYFPSTVRSLAETVTEREAEINQLRAELAALKAQGVVMPDVNAAAKALCNRHAMICGVDADDQWKEYSQDFIADAETVLANARLYAAPAAPAADAGLVLEQAMYALIGIGYHENSGLVHELRQSLAAHRAKGAV